MNINDFIAQISNGNLAKPSLFDVIVTPPTQLLQNSSSYDLMYRCESIDLPGRNVLTSDYTIYGLSKKIGYGSTVNDINLSFILSEDYNEKLFFESWVDLITGSYRTGDVSQNMFEIGYYKDYVGTIVLRNYDETGQESKRTTFYEAYPTNIGNVSLSWADGSTIAKLPVQIFYRYYIEE